MYIRCRLKSSQSRKLGLLTLHAVALAVVCWTELPAVYALLISLAIFLSLSFHIFSETVGYKRRPANEFVYAKDRITFFAGGEIFYDGKVMPNTVVTPYFILLCLHSETEHSTTRKLICRDALTAEEFRQLSVALRLA